MKINEMCRGAASALLPLLLYTLLAAIALGANPFRHQTITPFDILVSQRAWHFVDPHVHVRNYHRSDILNALVPQWTEARHQLRDGHLPLWNDKVAGGGSFLPVSSTIFTPAFAVFAASPDPATGFYAAVLLNLALGGLGMHLLLRRRFGWIAAVTGAFTFQVCGFSAAWLYWPHILTIVWAPWLFLAVDACATRPGLRSSLAIAAASTLVLLGGFPFVSLLVYEAAALYALIHFVALWRSGGHPPWGFAAWYVAGTLLGVGLSVVPVASLVAWLHQFDIKYRYGRGSYLDISYWKQLLPPWAYREQGVEETMYVGFVMVVLAAASIVTCLVRWRLAAHPLLVFGLALFVVSVILVFGLSPLWLLSWLPGMAYNSWSRAIGLLDISLIILGAAALDWLWRYLNRGRLRLLRAVVLLLAAGQMAEAAVFFREFNGPVDADYYYPQTPSISYVQHHAGPFDYVVTDKSFLMSGTLGAYGLREWLAHYFRTPALQAILHKMAERPFNSHRASASRFPASDIEYASPTMAAYNVRYLMIDSRTPLPTSEENPFRRVYESQGTAVYENRGSPNGPYFLADLRDRPNSDSSLPIRIHSYRSDAFVLQYSGLNSGYVVVPMTITKEWTVTANGNPTPYLLKDGVLPAVKVTGPTNLVFSYTPGILRWLPLWAVFLVVMLLAMVIAQRWMQRGRPVLPTAAS